MYEQSHFIYSGALRLEHTGMCVSLQIDDVPPRHSQVSFENNWKQFRHDIELIKSKTKQTTTTNLDQHYQIWFYSKDTSKNQLDKIHS